MYHCSVININSESSNKMVDVIHSNTMGLYDACKDGNLEIIHELIEKGETNWNNGLEGACCGGRDDIIIMMVEKGATSWDAGLKGEGCMPWRAR